MGKRDINGFCSDSCSDSCSENSGDPDFWFNISSRFQNQELDNLHPQHQENNNKQIRTPPQQQVNTNDTTLRQTTRGRRNLQNSNNDNPHGNVISVGVERNSRRIRHSSNETKNLPSQMGRLIVNHLKSLGHNNLPKANSFKKRYALDCLIKNSDYRMDVLNYFRGNQILFDVLKSSKLQLKLLMTVIDRFDIYYDSFLEGKSIENQTHAK